jgi:flagellar biosynthesis protein FlhG
MPVTTNDGPNRLELRTVQGEPGAYRMRRQGPQPFQFPASTQSSDGAASPRIWAVGGGKGGVGKSVIISSLAVSIAGSGRRCAVIDLDLGGANLHTLLGVERPRRTLSHFLDGDVKSLAEVMSPTSVPNLSLVSGSHALLEIANPKHAQKLKLLRHIRGLDVDDVLLDLGAGSAFNTLDFFLAARRGMVVVSPEPTSVENSYHFLKAAFYRWLRAVARRSDARIAINRVWEEKRHRPVRSARELIERVKEVDPPTGKLLAERARAFSPMLIVNQVRTHQQRQVGPDMSAACREHLGIELEYLGALEADPRVEDSVDRRRPVLQLHPRSIFAQRIEGIAHRLLWEERGDEKRATGDPGFQAEQPSLHAPVPRTAPEPAAAAPAVTPAAETAVTPAAETAEASVASQPAPTPSLPPLDCNEPGAYFRRCREVLGLSLAEVTECTRIRDLDRIENERFDDLPPDPNLRGFLFEYARALGICDAEPLVRSFLERRQRSRVGGI